MRTERPDPVAERLFNRTQRLTVSVVVLASHAACQTLSGTLPFSSGRTSDVKASSKWQIDAYILAFRRVALDMPYKFAILGGV